jgi:hypothetical protein
MNHDVRIRSCYSPTSKKTMPGTSIRTQRYDISILATDAKRWYGCWDRRDPVEHERNLAPGRCTGSAGDLTGAFAPATGLALSLATGWMLSAIRAG